MMANKYMLMSLGHCTVQKCTFLFDVVGLLPANVLFPETHYTVVVIMW